MWHKSHSVICGWKMGVYAMRKRPWGSVQVEWSEQGDMGQVGVAGTGFPSSPPELGVAAQPKRDHGDV